MVSQAIAGLGGVGKTQLALHYAHAHLHEYDIVAWVLAEQDATGGLSALADALGIPAGDLTPGEHAQLALRHLEACEERWLLVLDNLPGPEEYEACAPSRGTGTSWSPRATAAWTSTRGSCAVDVFDDATGADYLTEPDRPRPEEREAAAALSHALGGLPLALAHAGAYCARGVGFADYQALLSLPARGAVPRAPGRRSTARRSRRRGPRRSTPPASRPRTRAPAGDHGVPGPDGHPSRARARRARRRARTERRLRLLDALCALDTFSLIDLHGDELDTHRLLQKVIRDDARDRDDGSGAEAAFAAVESALPDDVELPPSWPQCELLVAHIDAATTTTADLVSAARRADVAATKMSYLFELGDGDRATSTALAANGLAS